MEKFLNEVTLSDIMDMIDDVRSEAGNVQVWTANGALMRNIGGDALFTCYAIITKIAGGGFLSGYAVVTTAGTSTSAVPGLETDLIRAANPQIPAFKIAGQGTCHFISDSQSTPAIAANYNGFGGVAQKSSDSRTVFARKYQESGAIGAWTDRNFTAGLMVEFNIPIMFD